MKKIVFILLTIFITNNLNAISWAQMGSWSNKTIKPDVQYNLETEGYNVRVYEFTPVSDPGSTCVMTFTNEKMGMFCFAKSKEALRKEN
jgi:hypothetical protein